MEKTEVRTDTWVSLTCLHVILHCLPLLLGLKWTGSKAVAKTLSSYVIFELFDVGGSGHPIYTGTWYGYPGGRPSNFLIPGSTCIERVVFLGAFIAWFFNFSFLLCPFDPEETPILVTLDGDFPGCSTEWFLWRPSPFKAALLSQLGSESRPSSQPAEQTYHRRTERWSLLFRGHLFSSWCFPGLLSLLPSFFPSYTASCDICYLSSLSYELWIISLIQKVGW